MAEEGDIKKTTDNDEDNKRKQSLEDAKKRVKQRTKEEEIVIKVPTHEERRKENINEKRKTIADTILKGVKISSTILPAFTDVAGTPLKVIPQIITAPNTVLQEIATFMTNYRTIVNPNDKQITEFNKKMSMYYHIRNGQHSRLEKLESTKNLSAKKKKALETATSLIKNDRDEVGGHGLAIDTGIESETLKNAGLLAKTGSSAFTTILSVGGWLVGLFLIVVAVILTLIAYFVFTVWILVGIVMAYVAYRRHKNEGRLMRMYSLLLGFTLGPWYGVWLFF